MTPQDIQDLALGALQGLGASTVFLLVLFIGFCVVFNFPKLRAAKRKGMMFRSLEDRMTDHPIQYLPPNAPRGNADQLHSPELQEAAARK